MENSDILKKIKTTPLLVAYFSIPTCHVCLALRPKVEEVVNRTPGTEYIYIDTQEYPIISGQHLVFSFPTVIIFSNGHELKRWIRYLSIETFAAELERISKRQSG